MSNWDDEQESERQYELRQDYLREQEWDRQQRKHALDEHTEFVADCPVCEQERDDEELLSQEDEG